MLVVKIALILILWIPVCWLLFTAAGDLFGDLLKFQRAERQRTSNNPGSLRVVPKERSSRRPVR